MTIQEDRALRDTLTASSRFAPNHDQMLVEACLRGDIDAFAVIVDEHRVALTTQARRMLGPDGPIEDAVQETFERALKYLDRFGRTGEYRLGAWLNQILKSVVQSHWQRRGREQRSQNAGIAYSVSEPDVAEQVGDPVTAAALRDAVRALPDSQRAAFVMREMVGMPYAEVADALGINEDNARARVSRSKSQLRRSTATIRATAGGFVGLPFGLRALGWRVQQLWRNVRGKGGVFEAGDRVATQLSASPVAQSAVSFVTTGMPRGALVFGVAATVATLGASTAMLASTAQPTTPSVRTAPIVAPLASPIAPMGTPSLKPIPPAGTGSVPAATKYAWVDPSSAASAPAVALAAGSCRASDGVVPPGAGFSSGTPLGLADMQAVATASAVDLSTVGPAFSLTTSAPVSTYGSSATSAASINSDVCLSSSGAWFTATVGGVGAAVDLQGTLQMVTGTSNDYGYIFRGAITPLPSDGPLAGSTQFVADVTVTEPDNTAQLTIVFLNSGATTTSGGSGTSEGSGAVTPQPTGSSAQIATPPDFDSAAAQSVAQLMAGSGSTSTSGGPPPFTETGPPPLGVTGPVGGRWLGEEN